MDGLDPEELALLRAAEDEGLPTGDSAPQDDVDDPGVDDDVNEGDNSVVEEVATAQKAETPKKTRKQKPVADEDKRLVTNIYEDGLHPNHPGALAPQQSHPWGAYGDVPAQSRHL